MDQPQPLFAADRRAKAVTVDTTISTATDVTLNAATTWVRVFAKDKGIYVRGQATASAANWDWFVPLGLYVDIVIPAGTTVLSFIEETSSAKLILAEYD
jgi:hypothetical protein